MATPFPQSTYTISDRTQFNDDHVVARDLLDDGSMRLRVLGDSSYQIIRCVFEHMTESSADTFIKYLRSNKTTEFDMTFAFNSPSSVYRGYIWSDPRDSVTDGVLHTVSFDFRGAIV